MLSKKIMVVEDDPIIARVLIERLKKLDYVVCASVCSGEVVVQTAQETAPDLVLMDIRLEGKMDGIEAAQHLRSQLDLAVIYVSAFTDEALLQRAKKTEPLGYLVKPYGEKELRTTLEVALYKAEMEKRLRDSEARYRRLVENAPLGIFSFDSAGCITDHNARFLAIFRTDRDGTEEPINVLDFPAMVQAGFDRGFRKCLDAGEPIVTEGSYVPEGSADRIFVRLNIVPVLSHDGSVVGGQAIAEDITERKRSEELQQQAVRYKAVADIASGVAHNFNNVLQIIMGNASFSIMKLESGDSSDLTGHLRQIVGGCASVADTVRRLQQVVAPRSDREETWAEVFDVSELAEQAYSLSTASWKADAERRGLGISLNLRADNGSWVKGNRDHILDVLVNVTKNAVEALPNGGQIDVLVWPENDRVNVQVRDNGIGIPQGNMARLFTPFFTTKPAIGRGLGLATSRRMVESHGGAILVESEEGKGTTVKIVLPLAQRPPESQVSPGADVSARRLNILVIDDMEEILKMFKAGLERHNNSVLTASSGEEGLEIFRTNPIDVVVCDLVMPSMNGWQVAERIRDLCLERGVPGPPFIIVTGWAELHGDEHKMAESGVDALIAKPVDLDKLWDTVGRLTAS